MIGKARESVRRFFLILWKFWGLLAAYVPILLLSPLLMLLVATGNLKWFWRIERWWSRWILFALGFRPRRMPGSASYDPKRQYIVVANHTSMIDIPLLLTVLKTPLTFVGKAELAKYPVFGYFYRKTNVLVDRASLQSRKKVYDEAARFIRKGLSIAIFPEGGVPDPSFLLAPFKNGAFRMAIAHRLPLLPVVFYDNKKRLPYAFFKGGPGKLRYKILPPVETEGLTEEDISDLRDYVYTLLFNELTAARLRETSG
ncbi:MAG: 1-acyl-sn-glycerol-3-phosphate acyltransferase [Chlorobi bacterium]|nr:1-acyl-sn-glycerol-3-phosphate acyltransferase [Chlorobiota bacterium]